MLSWGMRYILLLLLATSSFAQTPSAFDFDGKLPPLRLEPFRFKRIAAAVPFSPPASVIFSSRTARELGPKGLSQELSGADIVFVGESHDQETHHQIQLEVIKGLHAGNPGLQIGLEMLDVTQQPILDDYLAGRMSEADFGDFWNKTWGYPFPIYQPILAYARANGIPVKALNAPISVVRDIVRKGLDGLTPEQRALLPKDIAPIKDPRYLEYVKRSLDGHGPMPPEMKERMILAQAVWNETMAESLLSALPGGPVVVVVGMGHVFYGAGILESVRNRSSAVTRSVLPYPLDGEGGTNEELLRRLRDPASEDLALADYFWLLPD